LIGAVPKIPVGREHAWESARLRWFGSKQGGNFGDSCFAALFQADRLRPCQRWREGRLTLAT